MSHPPEPPVPPKHSSFLLFLGARGATSVAYQMLTVAVGWHIYALTGSAFALGMVGLVQFLPSLLLVLPVGHLADRYDRRRIVSLAQLGEVAALAGLVFVTLRHGGAMPIFGFIFLVGAARAFEYATLQTLVPSLVEPEVLPRAMAISSSVSQGATIVGPLCGGFLYLLGPAVVYACSATLFLLSAGIIATLTCRKIRLSREPATTQTLFAGIAYIRRRPVLLGAISLDLFAVLFGGATALLPIYAHDILQVGPQGLGLLRSAPAVGALAASLWLARRPLQHGVGRVLFSAVGCFGAATVVFALSRSIALTFVTLVLMGAVDMVSVVIRASLVQLETPDEMRGRVSAVNSVFIGTSNQLGEFESGVTAAWFGAVPAAVIGGIGTLVVVGLWVYLFPELLRRDRLQG